MRVKRKGILIFLVMVCLWLLTTTTVFAQAETFTQTLHDVTQTLPDVNPCTGDLGTITLTFNSVYHVTVDTDTGTGHETETTTGDFVFVPNDPALPTLTGHFTSWDGENRNIHNFTATETDSFHATGSDGSRLQGYLLAHITVNA